MQQTILMTLDVTTNWVILRIKKVFLSSVLELEYYNGHFSKLYYMNYISFYFLNIDGIVDSYMNVSLANLKWEICKKVQGVATVILCDVCLIG